MHEDVHISIGLLYARLNHETYSSRNLNGQNSHTSVNIKRVYTDRYETPNIHTITDRKKKLINFHILAPFLLSVWNKIWLNLLYFLTVVHTAMKTYLPQVQPTLREIHPVSLPCWKLQDLPIARKNTWGWIERWDLFKPSVRHMILWYQM